VCCRLELRNDEVRNKTAEPSFEAAEPSSRREMDDPNDLVLAMLGLLIAAIMLVAGALYVINAPDPIPTLRPPPAVQVSPIS
jgi:hypothetical protein